MIFAFCSSRRSCQQSHQKAMVIFTIMAACLVSIQTGRSATVHTRNKEKDPNICHYEVQSSLQILNCRLAPRQRRRREKQRLGWHLLETMAEQAQRKNRGQLEILNGVGERNDEPFPPVQFGRSCQVMES